MIRHHANLLTILFAVAVAASVVIHAVITWRSVYSPIESSNRHTSVTRVLPVDPSAATRLAPRGHSNETTRVPADASGLNIELRGVVVGYPSSTSTALIAVAGAPAKAFTIGDALPGGAILDGIEFDLVVLRLGSQLRTLGFAKSPSDGIAPSSTATAMTGGPSATAIGLPDHGMADPPDDMAENVSGRMASELTRGGVLSGEAVSAVNRPGGVARAGSRIAPPAPLH